MTKTRGWEVPVAANSKVEMLAFARFNGMGAQVKDHDDSDKIRAVIAKDEKRRKPKKG